MAVKKSKPVYNTNRAFLTFKNFMWEVNEEELTVPDKFKTDFIMEMESSFDEEEEEMTFIEFKTHYKDSIEKAVINTYIEHLTENLPKSFTIEAPKKATEKEEDVRMEVIQPIIKEKYGRRIDVSYPFEKTVASWQEKNIQNVNDGIEQALSSDGFKKYLDLVSNLNNYSFNNRMIVFNAVPDATIVKGTGFWHENERHIKKGEHYIYINTPNKKEIKSEEALVKEKEKRDKNGFFPITDSEFDSLLKELKEKGVCHIFNGVKPTPVLDISQTEGKDFEMEYKKNIEVKKEVSYDLVANQIKKAFGVECKKVSTSRANDIIEQLKEAVDKRLHCSVPQIIGITGEPMYACDKKNKNKFYNIENEITSYLLAKEFGIDGDCYTFGKIAEIMPNEYYLKKAVMTEMCTRAEKTYKSMLKELDIEKTIKKEAIAR